MTDTKKPEATFGGKTLILGEQGVEWTLREGVMPAIKTFRMTPADAVTFNGNPGPYELIIKPLEGNAVKVTNLWVLNVQPGPNPFESEITVADRRWMWSYGHVVRRYNMRRAVGTKRLLANDLQLDVNFDRAPDIAYWRWSLNGSVRWVAFSALADLMKAAGQAEKNYTGKTFTIKIDDRIGTKISNLPLEDVEIDDAGEQAVQRMMAYIPEAGVTVDYDGTVVFFSRAAGDEEKIIGAAMPEIWGEGHTDLVKNANIRPKEIHVLFTREVEVRFDFKEVSNAHAQTVTDEPLGELRRMENVLPITDYQLPVNGRTLPQGCWITVDDAFRSWGNLPIVGPTRTLDHDLVQRAFIPQMDLWAALQMVGERPDFFGNLVNWPGRISSLEKHYRQTFRLNSRWMDRFLSVRAYRLATIDPQSGQRGPSMAYGDYSLMASQRAIWRNHAQGHPLDYAINKSAYPTNANEYLDSTALPSPGIVSIEDHDQGIVRVDYAMDNNRTYEMVLPSQIQLDSMPTADYIQKTRPIAFNEIIEGFQPPRLSASFKMCFILTAIPASPNTTQQLHRIVIKPSDIKGFLPDSQRVGLDDAKGPIMEIRIGAGKEVARIAWKDEKSGEIEKIFGLTSGQPNLDGLVLNEGSSGGAFGPSLNAIAKAEAAAVYASLVDRYEGEMTGAMNGGLHLSGWVSEITHRYAPTGETTTRIAMPAQLPRLSMQSLMSSSERAIMLRLAQQ